MINRAELRSLEEKIADMITDPGVTSEDRIRIVVFLLAAWIDIEGGPCPRCALDEVFTLLNHRWVEKKGVPFPEDCIMLGTLSSTETIQ